MGGNTEETWEMEVSAGIKLPEGLDFNLYVFKMNQGQCVCFYLLNCRYDGMCKYC